MTRLLSLNLVGTSHCPGSQSVLKRALGCRSPSLRGVRLRREPDNAHDPNAIVVECQGRKIGYVARKQAASLAPELPADAVVDGRLVSRKALEIALK